MDTERVCTQCGKQSVPAQSICPKCGSALPAATPCSAPSASSHKVFLNKDGEEQILEYENIEQAMNGAVPWIMKGYIARITDAKGVVKWTQALSGGQIATYRQGDAIEQRLASGAKARSNGSTNPPRKPWWRFWG